MQKTNFEYELTDFCNISNICPVAPKPPNSSPSSSSSIIFPVVSRLAAICPLTLERAVPRELARPVADDFPV